MNDPQSGWGESSGPHFLPVQFCILRGVYLQRFVFVFCLLEAHVLLSVFVSDPWLKSGHWGLRFLFVHLYVRETFALPHAGKAAGHGSCSVPISVIGFVEGNLVNRSQEPVTCTCYGDLRRKKEMQIGIELIISSLF